MKKLLILILASLALAGCGAAGLATSASKLDVKAGGKDSTWNIKSGAVYYSAMAFTAPDKPAVKTSIHTIYLANFEMDTTGPAWMNKPLTAPDQMRVDFSLTGEDGTNEKSPLKVGTYSAQGDKVNGVRTVRINTFADGKQTETRFGTTKARGEVLLMNVRSNGISQREG
jgi:hypothetical protein